MKVAGALTAAALAIAIGATAAQAQPVARIVFAADRAPTVTGEIYRLDRNGHRVDLSKSPYQDLFPAVSPDGKHVAFISFRPRGNVYEVGINGRRLVRVGPTLPSQNVCDPVLAWQPHGNLLAVGACTKLWIVRPHAKPVKAGSAGLLPQWSPDGNVVLAATTSPTNNNVVQAFSAGGRALWHAKGEWFGSWSSHALFALPTKTGVAVYDESGHLRFRLAGRNDGPPAWSPNGDLLAVVLNHRLEMLAETGHVVLKKSLGGFEHPVVWNGNGHVVIGGFGQCQCHAKSVDLRTGKLTPASDRWFDPLSPDHKLAIVTKPHGADFALGVAPPASGPMRTYTHVPGCFLDGVRQAGVGSPQFAGRSIVYESWGFCDPPYANLYSVTPGGGKPQRLTNVQAQETQPAVSPDETAIAYVWAKFTGLSCKGCSDGIRLASADGTPLRTLTNPDSCIFDDSPTWSPDGTTILYSESQCDSAPELFTIPAGGGAPHDLGTAGEQPAWGPTRIAYVGTGPSNSGLWTANPDGSDPVKVTDRGNNPAWSSDGRLAYVSGSTLYVDGQSPVTLPFASIGSLAWSPDGTHFVVTARRKTDIVPDVYTVKADGTGVVRLTTNYDVFGASWR